MAFVLCPECGAPNSSLSMSCPKCGFPIGYVSDRSQLVTLNSNPYAEPEVYLEELDALEDSECEHPTPAALIAQSTDLPIEMCRLLCKEKDADIRAMMAQSTHLPSDLLDELSDDYDFRVRLAVASNIATGIETLYKLAEEQYDVTGSNLRIRIAVAKNPAIDRALIDKLSTDESAHIRAAIAQRTDVGQDVLMRLAADDTEVHTSYKRLVWTMDKAREMREFRGAVKIKELVALNPAASGSVLEMLARDDNESVRRAVASNKSANAEVLSLLVYDGSHYVRLEVAGNTSTGEANLCQMARDLQEYVPRRSDIWYRPWCDYDSEVAEAIALNPSATPLVFQQFREILDDRIARSIGENPSMNPETLRLLSEDADARFRAISGRHPLTTSDVLLRLARDDDEDVRIAVASNDNAPLSVAAIVAKDPAHTVRMAFAKSSSPFLELLLEDGDTSLLLEIAGNQAAKPSVLEAVSSSDIVDCRCAAASNTACPPRTLDRLSTDEDIAVRCAVAGNVSTRVGTVLKLSRDRCQEVRIAVAKRRDPSIASIYEGLAATGEREILDALLHNTYVPEDIRKDIMNEYGLRDPYDYDDYDDGGPDPGDYPLDGWHFDEDNGWLDYYPED